MLHPKCEAALRHVLTDRLGDVKVQNGSFLAFDAAEVLAPVNAVLPERGEGRTDLDRWIGDDPASSFATGYLTARLNEQAEFDHQAEVQPILSILNVTASDLANDIVDGLGSLPWNLEIALPIPRSAADAATRAVGAGELSLAPHLAVEAQGGSLTYAWPPPSYGLLGRVIASGSSQAEAPALLRYSGQGYTRHYTPTPLVADAMEAFLGIVGLCVVLGLFRTHAMSSTMPQKRSVEVFRRDPSGKREHLTSHEYPLDVSEFLLGLGGGAVLRDGFDPDGSFTRRQLGLLKAALGERADRSILRGAHWFAESLARRNNDLLSFIQGTVALEILLGEKAASDLVGIGELLANRCAYLIGKSHNERSQIRTDVKAIYDTRSRIVHRGHSRLSTRERSQLGRLRGLCMDVMDREMVLCAADDK